MRENTIFKAKVRENNIYRTAENQKASSIQKNISVRKCIVLTDRLNMQALNLILLMCFRNIHSLYVTVEKTWML